MVLGYQVLKSIATEDMYVILGTSLREDSRNYGLVGNTILSTDGFFRS